MAYADSQRKSFFMRASLKLSSMLEERILNDKTQEDFVDWCENTYPNNEPYDIASRVLFEFYTRILKEKSPINPVYKVKKELLSCDFAQSLYRHILELSKP